MTMPFGHMLLLGLEVRFVVVAHPAIPLDLRQKVMARPHISITCSAEPCVMFLCFFLRETLVHFPLKFHKPIAKPLDLKSASIQMDP